MISRSISAAAIAAYVFLVSTATALAADASKVGENTKGLVWDNAKPIWWIALLLAVGRLVFSRKTSQAGGILVAVGIAGIIIYNPAGVGSFMQDIADTIV